MLIPGIAHAFHAQVLSRSLTSIRKYRAEASAMLVEDPDLQAAVDVAVRSLTPADGLLMARLRGPCQLPFWSRLAIAQFRKNGYTIAELAEAFSCSRRTIVNVLGKTSFVSAERRLTRSQQHPPNKFSAEHPLRAKSR